MVLLIYYFKKLKTAKSVLRKYINDLENMIKELEVNIYDKSNFFKIVGSDVYNKINLVKNLYKQVGKYNIIDNKLVLKSKCKLRWNLWFHLKTSDSSGVFLFVFFYSKRIVIKYKLIEELIHNKSIHQFLLIKHVIFFCSFNSHLLS